MAIEQLIRVLPPPQIPKETPTDSDWAKVEEVIGEVPADYRSYIETYGTGTVDHFIWILNPASHNFNLNLIEQVPKQLSILKELVNSWNEPEVYPFFPDVGGLLPMGITDNGDLLLWKIGGNPNHWPVVVLESRSAHYLEFEASLTAFLAGVVSRQINVNIFPDDFPSDNPHFY